MPAAARWLGGVVRAWLGRHFHVRLGFVRLPRPVRRAWTIGWLLLSSPDRSISPVVGSSIAT